MRAVSRRFRLFMLLALPLLVSAAPVATTACATLGGSCCRVCRTGKACGDSCIERSKNCNVGPGCACNG